MRLAIHLFNFLLSPRKRQWFISLFLIFFYVPLTNFKFHLGSYVYRFGTQWWTEKYNG